MMTVAGNAMSVPAAKAEASIAVAALDSYQCRERDIWLNAEKAVVLANEAYALWAMYQQALESGHAVNYDLDLHYAMAKFVQNAIDNGFTHSTRVVAFEDVPELNEWYDRVFRVMWKFSKH